MIGAGLTPSGLSWNPVKKHFWGFKTQLGWVLLEFHLLHSRQEIMKILIVIFLRLFL